MNESDLSFETWWYLEQEKQRMLRQKRIRQSKRELAEALLRTRAMLLELEIKQREEAERRRQREGAAWLRPKPTEASTWRKPGALVRDLGLADKVCYRSLHFERIAANGNEVSLTVSSDAPYDRAFGTEILDHSPGSIRMDRMTKGAPLLFNHSRDAHLGRILSARTDGSKLNINAKFGNSALAREKLQDVQDGILREASIGYVIYNMREDSKGVFRATDWEPYEASLVTVPADYTVGVGRDA